MARHSGLNGPVQDFFDRLLGRARDGAPQSRVVEANLAVPEGPLEWEQVDSRGVQDPPGPEFETTRIEERAEKTDQVDSSASSTPHSTECKLEESSSSDGEPTLRIERGGVAKEENMPNATPRRLPRLITSGLGGLVADSGTAAGYSLWAASHVGLQHEAYGFSREDFYSIGQVDDPKSLVLGVADGVGSARDAHALAQQVVAEVAHWLVKNIEARSFDYEEHRDADWQTFGKEAVDFALRGSSDAALRKLAAIIPYRAMDPEHGGKDMRPPATTLCSAVVWPTRKGNHVIRWLAVGDCELRLLLPHGEIESLYSPARQGDGPSNATQSLPRNVAQLQTGTRVAEGGLLLLGSDGAFKVIDREKKMWFRRISDMVQSDCTAGSFAESLEARYKGIHDDRTLVVVKLSNDSSSP